MSANTILQKGVFLSKSIEGKDISDRDVPLMGRSLRYEKKPYRKMIKPNALIEVIRKYPRKDYTIGELNINGEYFCDTLEDADRGWYNKMSSETIENEKNDNNNLTKKELYYRPDKKRKCDEYGFVVNNSVNAIPTGEYGVVIEKSNFANGMTPHVLNVPGYKNIRIHEGNDSTDTDGCILVGYNKEKGRLVGKNNKYGVKSSKETIVDLVNKLQKYGSIRIKIRRDYGSYLPHIKNR